MIQMEAVIYKSKIYKYTCNKIGIDLHVLIGGMTRLNQNFEPITQVINDDHSRVQIISCS